MSIRTTASASALAVALLLTGCGLGGSDEGGSASPSSSGQTSTSTSSSSGQPTSDLDQAAADAGIDPTSPPKPLASVTMPLGGKLGRNQPTQGTVDLLSLRRQGDLLVLNIGITPKEGKPISFYAWTGNSWNPQIVDAVNLKAHDVVETDTGKLMTGTGAASVQFGGGQTYYLYAVFAAPPKDVTTVTVKAADGAPAFTGVKIQ